MVEKANPIQLQKYLSGLDYPAGKDAIVAHAESSGADQTSMDTLRRLPDRQYDGPNAISDEVGSLEGDTASG